MGLGFWKVCGAWALFLSLVLILRPHLVPRDLIQATEELGVVEGDLPSLGDSVALPELFSTVEGRTIPSRSDSVPTLFLVVSAKCPACRRDLPDFPNLLLDALELGYWARALVLPGSDEDNKWFLEGLRSVRDVILDSAMVAVSGLGVELVPAVVVVAPNSTVSAVYSPRLEWPVSGQMLAQAGQ